MYEQAQKKQQLQGKGTEMYLFTYVHVQRQSTLAKLSQTV